MKQEHIKHIIHESVNDIGERCAAVGLDFDKDAIHKFRVSVKSLRSFLRLQKMYTGNKKIKLTKEFRRLYDIAGVIREAQLELAFLEHKPALPRYTAQLHNKIMLAQEEWKQHYSHDIIDTLTKKLTNLKYKKMRPEALERFFRNRTEHIFQLALSTAPTDTDMHDARKKIKDILYTAKIAGKQWKGASKTTAPLEELDTLSDLIGDYNDKRIIIDHIKAIQTNKLEPGEKSNLKHLKDMEAKKLRKKKEAVLAATRRYPSPAKANN